MQPEVARRAGLAVAILVIVGAILVIKEPWKTGSSVPAPPSDLPEGERGLAGGADFRGATGWINAPNGSVDLVALRGHVVLVDFWTYSCINCIRTFPYLRAWNEAYGGAGGLQIVGVHTPEFRFERDPDNVRTAAQHYGLTWPMALDNDYRVWNAYDNRYWPAKYLLDQYGKIRSTHFGEGGYVETEDQIRALLAEADFPVPADHVGLDVNEDRSGAVSPELYAASDRSSIANPEGFHEGQNVTYADPGAYAIGRIYLVGTWHDGHEAVTAVSGMTAVNVRFHGGGANVVAGGAPDACIPIRLDGGNISQDRRGKDVQEAEGATCLKMGGPPRSYDFYAGPNEEHVVTFWVPAGFELYTFDFSDSQTTT